MPLEQAELPARAFYENHFPAIVKRYSPGVPYWPGSPFGGKEWYQTDDLTVGDVHEWHVWCGVSPGEYYQNYDILAGRFIRYELVPFLVSARDLTTFGQRIRTSFFPL